MKETHHLPSHYKDRVKQIEKQISNIRKHLIFNKWCY